MKVKIDEIIIPTTVAPPARKKLERKRSMFNKDNPITVNSNNVLTDGYCQYLICKEKGYDEVEVEVQDPNAITYVFGRHFPNGDEYVWKIKNQKAKKKFGKIEAGDHFWVQTKSGSLPITVTRVEVSTVPPIDLEIKFVLGRIKNFVQK